MSYNRRIGFEVYGNVGGAISALTGLNAGITRTATGFKNASIQGGLLEKQLKAIGTTARYALAGGIIFGVTGALSKLSQLQVALGNIQVVATDAAGRPGLSNSGIAGLGRTLIDISNRTQTPVQQLAETVQGLYSSLSQNIDTRGIEKAAEIVANTARLGNIQDTRNLAGTMLGGVTAFGMPEDSRHIDQSLLRLQGFYWKFLQLSRNVTGEEFSAQAGNLFKSAAGAGLTLNQTGALGVLSTRFGGTGAQNINNLAQLLIYLRNPHTQANKAAYAEAGITDPTAMGGWEILTKIIQHARSLGGVHGMSAQQLSALPDDATYGQAGVTGATQQYLNRVFGRIQSQRTLAVLLQTFPQLDKTVKQFDGTIKQSNDAVKRYREATPLSGLANRLGNAPTSLFNDVAPFTLNPAARVLNRGLDWTMHDTAQSKAARYAIEAAVGGGLAYGGLRMLRKRGFSPGAAAGALISTEEAASAIKGAPGDGSRANPIWVAIAPISWQLGGPGGGLGGPGGGGGGGGLFNFLKKVAPYAVGGYRALPWLAGKVARGGSILGADVLGPAAGDIANLIANNRDPVTGFKFKHRWARFLPWQDTSENIFKSERVPSIAEAVKVMSSTQAKASIGTIGKFLNQDVANGSMSEARAAQLMTAAMRRATGDNAIRVAGVADGRFEIVLKDVHGNQIAQLRKEGVPVKLWSATQFPTAGGKPKTRKGSGK